MIGTLDHWHQTKHYQDVTGGVAPRGSVTITSDTDTVGRQAASLVSCIIWTWWYKITSPVCDKQACNASFHITFQHSASKSQSIFTHYQLFLHRRLLQVPPTTRYPHPTTNPIRPLYRLSTVRSSVHRLHHILPHTEMTTNKAQLCRI